MTNILSTFALQEFCPLHGFITPKFLFAAKINSGSSVSALVSNRGSNNFSEINHLCYSILPVPVLVLFVLDVEELLEKWSVFASANEQYKHFANNTNILY